MGRPRKYPLEADITQVDTPTVEEVSVAPQVKLEKDDLVVVHIDRDMTDGGIRVNGKLYVGNVKVTPEQAADLMRIQEEYWETKKKLTDPNVHVRMKNDYQKEKLFLADPRENSGKKNWTRDYGLLPAIEWSYLTEAAKKDFLSKRYQLYGY